MTGEWFEVSMSREEERDAGATEERAEANCECSSTRSVPGKIEENQKEKQACFISTLFRF